MKTISIYVDSLIEASGLTGNTVTVVRHILLVIIAVVLSALAGILFRKILKPLVLKITAKTKNTWDDILLSDRVLTSASQIVPAVVIWVLLPMVFSQYLVVREVIARITAVYITVMSVRLAIVLIDSLQQLGKGKRSAKHQYFHSFCGVLKILIIFIAVIVVVAIVINKNPPRCLPDSVRRRP